MCRGTLERGTCSCGAHTHTCRNVRVKTAWLRELQSLAFVAATVLSLPPYVRSCDISSQLETAMEVKPST